MKLEAPPGFEPGVEVLQTSALPLGDGAFQLTAEKTDGSVSGPGDPNDSVQRGGEEKSSSLAVRRRAFGASAGQLLPASLSKSWSGKRDSNPRLRPWQGRTLPLSYSRSPNA